MHRHNSKQKEGFALLMSLIVVSVVVSIGLNVLDLTTKQLKLSTNSKDSEIAFHATNAGLECARYWRVAASTTIEAGGNLSNISCFGATPSINVVPVTGAGAPFFTPNTNRATAYQMDFTWGPTNDRCSQIYILSIDSSNTTETIVTNIQTIIPGYPQLTKTCAAGGHCTVISVKGYSRACSQITTSGTVQREVLLEL